MKKVVVTLSLIVCVWGFYKFVVDKELQQESSVVAVLEKPFEASEQANEEKEVKNAQDLKREQMLTRFSDLKESRKQIQMRLSRLSSRLRRTKFPPDQAKNISHDMRRGNYLLKNPKLLGAFLNIREIENELEQLSDVDRKLDAIKRLLDEKRQQKP